MDEHKKWVKVTFDQAAPDFGEKGCTYFDHFGAMLVDLARLSKNDHVLDVATGKGAVILPAVQKLGPSGKIVGVDISKQMIIAAKKRAPHVQFLQMDAERLAFSDRSFDIVFCAFALYFFPEIQTALSEFKRVLKKGGRIAVSSFGKRESLTDWTLDRTRDLGADRRLKTNALDTPESLREQLDAAGLKDIEIHEKSNIYSFESPQAWWDSLWTHGVRAQLQQLSPPQLESLRKEAFERARRLCPTGRVDIECKAIFGLGHI
jgi:ubiquinone/menaquinone biosynthesis C-methylase UbiE